MDKMMNANYAIKARIYPVIIGILPFIIVFYLFLNDAIAERIQILSSVSWLDDIAVIGVSLYFLGQLSRFIGKELFEKRHFANELRLPTTDLLSFRYSSYSLDRLTKLRRRIESDFDIHLPSIDEEEGHPDVARQKIAEAVSHVRAKVKSGRLTIQHNIEYGFVRNLIGVSLVSVILSIAGLLLFVIVLPTTGAIVTMAALLALYITPLLLSGWLLRRFGVMYAKVLFQEYLSLD